ncbi:MULTISPECIES: cell division protein SepF [Thermomonospora]|uniref:Cell division protein SepF n=1 Tax=Thermomonospora cellulosilytica TaxID=1411118 RepID=A0A7W3RBR1_9ACTN|nr:MULTISPECIES: cell division protein SepF [Thermomonospora]MBA9006495.1 cell division inhibitor SepF [Thermomonospora cellulosilytica]
MASAMRKMAVYLGLVEDDRYDDKYDDYDEYDVYDDEAVEPAGRRRPEDSGGQLTRAEETTDRDRDHHVPSADGRRSVALYESGSSDLARITTLHPRTYNEARIIGEHFREGTPVIMNLTEMSDSDAKRLVDFAAGLIFGLHGSIDRVTNKVFLLTPANVEVTAEDKARMAERGFFNQS